MTTFVEYLRLFNRKERFYLVGWALGRPTFRLGDDFRKSLSDKIHLKISSGAFAAMDYHLNWIYAAAYLSSPEHENSDVYQNREIDEPDVKVLRRIIQGNQEDIDLVVAFEDGPTSHIVMVEAKGVTRWNTKQLNSKAGRLKAIFGDLGNTFPHIARPHFVVASPFELQHSAPEKWPDWMKGDAVKWLQMNVPPDLLKVKRVNARGTHWEVVPERQYASSDAATDENRDVVLEQKE